MREMTVSNGEGEKEMDNKDLVNKSDYEFRLSIQSKDEREQKRRYEYFTDELDAMKRFRELRAQNYSCHLDHMDISLGITDYEIDWLE